MEITRNEKTIEVVSEFNPDLPSRAKKLGGKWNKSAWVFDIRDEARVEKLYRDIYGEWDGDEKTETVTIQITAKHDLHQYHGGIFFGGRQVARATGRDSGARLGGGVVLIEGNATSGGSVKNWTTRILESSIIEIKDFPVSKVNDYDTDDWECRIVGKIDSSRASLETEKAALLKRLAEVDAMLKNIKDS